METFIKNDGYLIWDKSEVVNINNTKIVKTPFAFEGTKEINGYIQMQKLPENKGFTYEFFRTKNLGKYNFNDQNSRLNGNRIHYNINTFNKKLYAKDTFNLVHPSQLPQSLVNNPKINWRTTKAMYKPSYENNRVEPGCATGTHAVYTVIMTYTDTDLEITIIRNCVQDDIVVTSLGGGGSSWGSGSGGINGYWSGIFVSGGGSNGTGSGSGGYNGYGGFYGGDPNNWYGGGGNGPNVNLINPALAALVQQLGLNIAETIFLENNPDEVLKITNFLNSSLDLAVDNFSAKNHIQKRISDTAYNTFCTNHTLNYSANTVWWKDDLFLQSFGGLSFGQWAINYLNANPNVTFDVFENQFLVKSEGLDGSYDASYWENPSLSFPPDNLPSWIFLYATYPKHADPLVNTPLKLYTIMGGNVLATYNSNPAAYQNTCALRISRALNLSLRTIPPGPDRYLDMNGHYNFLSARALLAYMKKKYGTPTGSNLLTGAQGGLNGENFPNLLAGKKGIYIMIPNYPGGCPVPPSTTSTGFCASGHADIIDNSKCDGSCYFGATGGVDKIYIWELP